MDGSAGDGTDGGGLPVGEVARLAGVTVRTLHHYDEIGLLRPGGRTAAGYRLYDETDLLRLQRVLAYRELGFSLEEVARLLAPGAGGGTASPDDELALLRRQRDQLVARIERLRTVLLAVETTMEARTMGIELTPQEILEVFGDDDPTQYADEAAERWGDTDAYKQSQARARSYGKADWARMKAEQEACTAAYADLFRAGAAAAGSEAMDAAEAHRQLITRWFYDCDHTMHRGLADMYVEDPRFTAHYDAHAPGLAAWVRNAVHANADRAQS
ncbi:MerR family transcriptional regulator [Kineosporia sp. A_224]|uniref:MerR family transcriptional regulator n=1 Tax=Kineosporia sp. A_224 TaxID=1962180 RepID=UPI000B4A8C51|nr:MerR family transcriptional regulator [Kineosporia sp. A_224]